jgi:serine/threonine protein kinase
MIGKKLGPYEILESIGSGGMGEVWKAKDPRLGRTVAIKKVKEQHSERFKQEAWSIASLNHPYIWDYASYCTSLGITSATF